MIPIAILVAVWQGFSLLFGAYWVPSPWSTVFRLAQDVVNGEVVVHALYTSSEAALGFIIGSVPGVALPFVLRRRPVVTAVLDPFVAAGYGVPKLVLAPILIVWFGLGIGSKVALVAVSAFFVVYFSTAAGVRAVDDRLVRMARVAGATERQLARHLVLPAAAPYIFAGMRMALPYSVGGAVVAELLSANRGLGYLLQLGATSFDPTGVFAALVVISLMVLAGNVVVDRAERHCLRWRAPAVRPVHVDAIR